MPYWLWMASNPASENCLISVRSTRCCPTNQRTYFLLDSSLPWPIFQCSLLGKIIVEPAEKLMATASIVVTVHTPFLVIVATTEALQMSRANSTIWYPQVMDVAKENGVVSLLSRQTREHDALRNSFLEVALNYSFPRLTIVGSTIPKIFFSRVDFDWLSKLLHLSTQCNFTWCKQTIFFYSSLL